MPAGNALEYAEEDEDDLFGSDHDDLGGGINTAQPIAGPSSAQATSSTSVLALRPDARSMIAVAGPSSSSSPTRLKNQYSPDERLQELRILRRARLSSPSPDHGDEHDRYNGGGRGTKRGPKSLKQCCMTVVKTHSARIWDIGDLEYTLIKPFIDEVGKEQLAEIEEQSPHIKRDTDWLWEIFILEDYPLFHERCRDRRGEPRTTGWRRMYRKAVEDAASRQAQAADRVAARYKQLEEEKASKRIQVIDKALPDRKKSGWGRSKTSTSGSIVKPIGAIAKARVDAQRARVALTHASGRYIPPPPPNRPKVDVQASLFTNPYLPSSSPTVTRQQQNANVPIPIARLPPPRLTSSSVRERQRQRASSPSSLPSSSTGNAYIPGSYPSSQSNHVRQSLPSHLTGRASNTSSCSSPTSKLSQDIPKSKFKIVKKPELPSFELPKLEKEPKKQVIGFFDNATATTGSTTQSRIHSLPNTTSSKNRSGPADDSGSRAERAMSEKKSDVDEVIVIGSDDGESRTRSSPMKRKVEDGHPTISISSPSSRPLGSPRFNTHGPTSTASAEEKINNILFRKKKIRTQHK